MPSDLRDFLKRSLDQRIVNIVDKPGADPNCVEGFLLETNGMVASSVLLVMLERYYLGAKIVVRGEDLHWVKSPNKTTLLLNIINRSKIGGARFFGGNPNCGGIRIRITEHPEL